VSYEEVPTQQGEDFGGEFEGRVTSEGHGSPPVHAGGGRAVRSAGYVVPIARRIEALEPLQALYAEISATGG